jgi:hypothetical protein
MDPNQLLSLTVGLHHTLLDCCYPPVFGMHFLCAKTALVHQPDSAHEKFTHNQLFFNPASFHINEFATIITKTSICFFLDHFM